MRSLCAINYSLGFFFQSRYLSRFEDELEQIAMVNDMKGRTKCQHAARKQAIKMTLEVERQQYETSGFGKIATNQLVSAKKTQKCI